MTYLEKAMEIKKDPLTTEEYIMSFHCPSHFDLEDSVECDSTDNDKCTKCWKREMPDTEIKPKEDMDREDYRNLGYNQGLNDAWELADKFNNMTLDEVREVLGISIEREEIFGAIYPQEALAKLKAYEEAQDEIKVGDVVTYSGEKCLVLDTKGDRVVVLTGDGCVLEWHKCDVEKTGKHIELDGLLEQIGE